MQEPDCTQSTTVTLGPSWDFREDPVATALSMASSALCAYHGYRRNDSIFWGILWGGFGASFSVIAPAIAVAQGFGKSEAHTSREAALAALSTNEYTKDLKPHLRAKCFCAAKSGEPSTLTYQEQMALLDEEAGITPQDPEVLLRETHKNRVKRDTERLSKALREAIEKSQVPCEAIPLYPTRK